MMGMITPPPPNDALSLDVNVLELMLFGFGLLVTIGVTIMFFVVLTREGKNSK